MGGIIKSSLLTVSDNVKWHLTWWVMNCARVEAGGMTAKEASLAATNLDIQQFIIPENQSTAAAICH